jgi:hypothetical protein
MRRRYTISIVVAMVVIALWYVTEPRTGSRPQFLGGTPVSIDIKVMDDPSIAITNAAGVASVINMLRTGRSVRPHECKRRGRMVLNFADGSSITMGFLPGHNFLRYEFDAQGGMFTVSRSRFLGALKAAGVDINRI